MQHELAPQISQMAETSHTTPLISPFGDRHNPSPPPELEEKLPPTLDSAIEQCIGEFGWAQLTQATLVSLSWFFDGQQTFITVFTDSQPPWHCTDSSCVNGGSDICNLPASSWAWDQSRHVSVVSEWNLQCAAPFVKGLPASAFFAGCLAGGILLATLADTAVGRRNMLLLSTLTMSAAAFLTAFTDSVWVYAALRFVCGFGRATIGTCALVLSTELVGRRWRGTVGMVGFCAGPLGFLSLPVMAFANRGSSWRNLYLWTSVPGFLYCVLVYFFVYESPRWLFIRGRKAEAFETLKSIAPPNRQSHLNSAVFATLTTTENSRLAAVNLYSALKLLLQNRWALHRLLSVTAIGFGTGAVYYGTPLGIGNLSFNLYAGVAVNALSELPFTFLAMFLLAKFNRRASLLFLTTVGGLSAAAVCFVTSPPYQMGFEVVSFGSVCAALYILLIYALELFPTCVRNSAVSMVRQALVLGGVFGPLLVAAGKASGGGLTFGVFGFLVGCFGMFVAWLPETRGGTLSDTMEEEELKMTTHTQ